MDLVKGSSKGQVSPGKWYLESYTDKLCPLLGKLFVFAYTWSFGGVLNRLVLGEVIQLILHKFAFRFYWHLYLEDFLLVLT